VKAAPPLKLKTQDACPWIEELEVAVCSCPLACLTLQIGQLPSIPGDQSEALRSAGQSLLKLRGDTLAAAYRAKMKLHESHDGFEIAREIEEVIMKGFAYTDAIASAVEFALAWKSPMASNRHGKTPARGPTGAHENFAYALKKEGIPAYEPLLNLAHAPIQMEIKKLRNRMVHEGNRIVVISGKNLASVCGMDPDEIGGVRCMEAKMNYAALGPMPDWSSGSMGYYRPVQNELFSFVISEIKSHEEAIYESLVKHWMNDIKSVRWNFYSKFWGAGNSRQCEALLNQNSKVGHTCLLAIRDHPVAVSYPEGWR